MRTTHQERGGQAEHPAEWQLSGPGDALAHTVQIFKSPKPSAADQQTDKHNNHERTHVREGPNQSRQESPYRRVGMRLMSLVPSALAKNSGFMSARRPTSRSIARIWSEREQQPPRRHVMHGCKRLRTGAAARWGGAKHSPLSTAHSIRRNGMPHWGCRAGPVGK